MFVDSLQVDNLNKELKLANSEIQKLRERLGQVKKQNTELRSDLRKASVREEYQKNKVQELKDYIKRLSRLS